MAFKTMQWIRKVRDEDYKECRKMGLAEKIAHTRAMAKRLTKKKPAAVPAERSCARVSRS